MNDGIQETSAENLVQSSPCLQGERVAFTGTLASMTHQWAFRVVEEHGGIALQSVSRQTTMLVVGEEGWPLDPDGQPSLKLQQVTAWQQEGLPAQIVKESDWLHLLGLNQRREEIRRLYTPAMLSQLLEIPANLIRAWQRQGLITAVRHVYRLPYFDFQEVAQVRRLSELMSEGISRRELEKGLVKLLEIFPEMECSLTQLDLLERDAHLVYRDQNGLVEATRGQRLFDFEPPVIKSGPDEEPVSVPYPDIEQDRQHWSVDDWYIEGCRHLERGDSDDAAEAFRLCLMERPGDSEINFLLAEALYRNANPYGALERYYSAVELDHNYIEAWTQLGCIHAELDQPEAALEALKIALSLHPDYPDAHYHSAEILSQLGRDDEAVPHWKEYLDHDSRGPWAETARQRLAEADYFEGSSESETDSE